MTIETTNENTRPLSNEIESAVGDYNHDVVEAQVQAMIDPEKSPQVVDVSPQMAAHVYIHHNVHNRDVSAAKVGEYKRVMDRGEWMLNHQGVAFYDSGTLADGQHRLAATALSGKNQEMLVYVGFQKEAIQTIDLGKARTSAEALKMDGIEDGSMKATVSKLASEYHHMVEHGTRPKYTQIQIVAFAKANDGALSRCISKADFLIKTVTDSPMTRSDVVLHLFILTKYGHFSMDGAADFVGSVLTGVAPYEGAPQLVLSRVLTRAKHGAKQADKLSGVSRIAVIQKAAKIWSDSSTCSKLVWSKREGFPLAEANSLV